MIAIVIMLCYSETTRRGTNMMITIDIDALRKYMLDNSYAAFFVGDFGGALAESVDIENASDEELVEMAKRQGIDLRRFEVGNI